MAYDNVDADVGRAGQWSRGLCGFFETCAGCKAFVMGCNWPCCGPCLFAKISARVAWPKTQFESFGDSPFKQWFRISLLLICIYWLSSWGEGVSAPTPKFNLIEQSQADLKAFEKMDKLGAADAANVTGDAGIAAEGKDIDAKIESDMNEFDDFGEVKSLEVQPSPAIRPFHGLFAFIKAAIGIVWLVLVIMLRAHTRRQFVIPATCCACKVSGSVDFEDILCTVCCQPCTLSQMATHTGAISNESPCDCCDAEDPGPCLASLEPLQDGPSTNTPATNNSMKGGDNIV